MGITKTYKKKDKKMAVRKERKDSTAATLKRFSEAGKVPNIPMQYKLYESNEAFMLRYVQLLSAKTLSDWRAHEVALICKYCIDDLMADQLRIDIEDEGVTIVTNAGQTTMLNPKLKALDNIEKLNMQRLRILGLHDASRQPKNDTKLPSHDKKGHVTLLAMPDN